MRPRVFTLPIAAAFVVAFVFVAFPNVVIQPYTRQNPAALAISLFMLRHLRVIELICAAIAAATVAIAFAKHVRLGRWTLGIAAGIALCAAASRIDIYEILFHPYGKPSFEPERDAKLDGDEHLLAVNLAEPRAYPIRTISYHHVINDVIGGVPIAVTY